MRNWRFSSSITKLSTNSVHAGYMRLIWNLSATKILIVTMLRRIFRILTSSEVSTYVVSKDGTLLSQSRPVPVRFGRSLTNISA